MLQVWGQSIAGAVCVFVLKCKLEVFLHSDLDSLTDTTGRLAFFLHHTRYSAAYLSVMQKHRYFQYWQCMNMIKLNVLFQHSLFIILTHRYTEARRSSKSEVSQVPQPTFRLSRVRWAEKTGFYLICLCQPAAFLNTLRSMHRLIFATLSC